MSYIALHPLISGGYVPDLQWMLEPADGTEPYVFYVFLIPVYL